MNGPYHQLTAIFGKENAEDNILSLFEAGKCVLKSQKVS